MTIIESPEVFLKHSQEKLFYFLTDFRNYNLLMPEQVTNWVATEAAGSFNLKGMGNVGLRIKETIPITKILIVPEGKLPINFTLEILMEEMGEGSKSRIIINSDMNPMIKMMAEKPLKYFITQMAERLNSLPI